MFLFFVLFVFLLSLFLVGEGGGVVMIDTFVSQCTVFIKAQQICLVSEVQNKTVTGLIS